jgi:hypothetical protein
VGFLSAQREGRVHFPALVFLEMVKRLLVRRKSDGEGTGHVLG